MANSNPEKIGRYQIIERVGRGGMGVLYRGMDPVLDREVAIKLMLMDFSEDEEQMRPRFYREARAAAKLQHRNIVTVFEFAEEGSTPYIVMEFLRGTSLADRMKSPLPLTLDDKLNVVAQLCTALNYAHDEGVIHRDVKPANVFLLGDGTVKLLDFGIAKVTTSTLTRKGDVLGSASYMAPEQISGADDLDGRSDLFSAGVVLYELLSGRKPFEAEVPTAIIMKILHEQPPNLIELVPGLPAPLAAAVSRALAKSPADRFPSAGEFAKELQWIRKALQASGEGAEILEETRFASATEVRRFQKDFETGRPATTVTTTQSTSWNKWLVPGSIAAAVVVLGIAGAMMFGGRSAPVAEAPQSSAASTAPAAAAQATPAPASAPQASAPLAATGREAAPSRPAAGAAGAVSRRVQVVTEPEGASIAVDGRETKLVTPATVVLNGAGPHRLRLTKRGFLGQDVTVGDADVQAGSVSYTLQAGAAATVSVSITATYPVEVFQNGRSISGASDSHQLTVASGTNLRVAAPQYLLDTVLRVEGRPIEYQAPPLGYLTILTKYETCNVKIGSKDLGYPPITKLPIVAGQHRVDIACPTGPNPPGQFVSVTPNTTATARIY